MIQYIINVDVYFEAKDEEEAEEKRFEIERALDNVDGVSHVNAEHPEVY